MEENGKFFSMYDLFLEKIKEAKSILITRHINPDGDCLGSQYAIYHFIKENFEGKKIFCEGGTAKNHLKELFPLERKYSDQHRKDSYDLQIVVDTSSKDRVDGELLEHSKVFVLDHHKHQDKLGDHVIRDSRQPSACQVIAKMMFYLCDNYNLVLNNKIAKCLYIGIVTDTNRMWYKANSSLFDICSRLLTYKVDTQKIYEEVFYWGLNEIRFRNEMIEKAKLDKNVVQICLEPEEYVRFGIDYQTAKDLAMSLIEIKAARYFIIAVKNPETNKYHVSLRSKSLAIDDIARCFGGGGHPRASGVRVKNQKVLEEIICRVKKMASEEEKI